MSRIKTHETVSMVIGDKRPTFEQLIIRNYEPPKTPLYVSTEGERASLDLFGLG